MKEESRAQKIVQNFVNGRWRYGRFEARRSPGVGSIDGLRRRCGLCFTVRAPLSGHSAGTELSCRL